MISEATILAVSRKTNNLTTALQYFYGTFIAITAAVDDLIWRASFQPQLITFSGGSLVTGHMTATVT